MQKIKDNPTIISITGTKGKTITTRLVDFLIRQILEKDLESKKLKILRVDSDGVFINGRYRKYKNLPNKIWSRAFTVGPGRFMFEFLDEDLNKTRLVAILESSVGSSLLFGTCFPRNQIGAFLNVYEDHLGVTEEGKTRAQIAKRKAKIVFSKLKSENGKTFAIFNANDSLVCRNLNQIPKSSELIPFFVKGKKVFFDVETHIKSGGHTFLFDPESTKILIKTKSKDFVLGDTKNTSWTHGGYFMPANLAILSSLAIVYPFLGSKTKTKKAFSLLNDFSFDKGLGRNILIKEHGRTIFIDYAHEKYSLKEVSDFFKRMQKDKGLKSKKIAVIRFAPDRTNDQLEDYGKSMAKLFDEIVVYDKIDGKRRKIPKWHRYYRKPGEVSKIVFDAIKQEIKNKNLKTKAKRIIDEGKAIRYALEIAHPGDFVLIVPNEFERTLEFVKNAKKL